MSGLIVHPTSCWVTGSTSIVVAGTDARTTRDGEVVLVGDQRNRVVTLPDAGRLRITAVQDGRACLTAASGAIFAVDVASGEVGPSCAAAPSLSSSPTSVKVPASSPATSSPSAPQPSSSLYVYGSYIDACGPSATTGCPLFNDGSGESVPPTGGMTILDFGAPCFDPSTLAWGTQLFNSQSCTLDGELVTLAQAWIRGYETNPNRSASTAYIVAAGTSNSLTAAVPGYALTQAQMSAHGQAWFLSVVKPIASAAVGVAAPVAAWSGSDIEESSDGNWYDAPTTGAWVDGYAAASAAAKPCVSTKTGLMADYGDLLLGECRRVGEPEPVGPERRAPDPAVHRSALGGRHRGHTLGLQQLERVAEGDRSVGSLSERHRGDRLRGRAPTGPAQRRHGRGRSRVGDRRLVGPRLGRRRQDHRLHGDSLEGRHSRADGHAQWLAPPRDNHRPRADQRHRLHVYRERSQCGWDGIAVPALEPGNPQRAAALHNDQHGPVPPHRERWQHLARPRQSDPEPDHPAQCERAGGDHGERQPVDRERRRQSGPRHRRQRDDRGLEGEWRLCGVLARRCRGRRGLPGRSRHLVHRKAAVEDEQGGLDIDNLCGRRPHRWTVLPDAPDAAAHTGRGRCDEYVGHQPAHAIEQQRLVMGGHGRAAPDDDLSGAGHRDRDRDRERRPLDGDRRIQPGHRAGGQRCGRRVEGGWRRRRVVSERGPGPGRHPRLGGSSIHARVAMEDEPQRPWRQDLRRRRTD